MEYKRLGDYIREVNVRNKDLKVTNLQGVSISKLFIPSIANTIGTDMSTYKVVNPGQVAYGPVTSRNGDKVSIALYKGDDDAIISQAYTVFEVVDKDKMSSDYLMMCSNVQSLTAMLVSILMVVLVRYLIGMNYAIRQSLFHPSNVSVKS